MTLPSSGPLSLSDIQTEFGGSNPASLSEYYAGGTYVPAGTSGTYGAVPISGEISIRNFYGTSNAVVDFTDASVSNSGISNADAGYWVVGTTATGVTAGNVYTIAGGVSSQYEQWITPTTTAADYEIYVTVSGDTPSGTIGSWVDTGTNPAWSLALGSSGYLTCTLTLQVRKTGTSTVLDTWYVYLEALVF